MCIRDSGSWIWVKKNPRQLFSLLGAFNPMVLHRHQRTMRRHLVLFDFLKRAVLAGQTWSRPDPQTRERLRIEAMDEWFPASDY